MYKKGEGAIWWILGVVFFMVLIAVITTLLITLNNQERKKQLAFNDGEIDVYLYSRDYGNNSIDSSYYLKTNTNVFSGEILEDSITEVDGLMKSDNLTLFCSSEGYYTSKNLRFFTPFEREYNVSKVYCYLKKIGNLDINGVGNIIEGNSEVRLNISTSDTFKKIGICTSWSPGVVNVDIKYNNLYCNGGYWSNISSYDYEKNKPIYYEKDLYACFDNLEYCEEVLGNVCIPKNKEKPIRFNRIVDKCFYTGRTIDGSREELVFNVKGININSLDYVHFYVFDYELVKETDQYLSELNGKNLGNPKDFEYILQ